MSKLYGAYVDVDVINEETGEIIERHTGWANDIAKIARKELGALGIRYRLEITKNHDQAAA